MRLFSLIVLTMGIVCSQAAAGPLISYEAYAQARLEIVGIRDASGALLAGKPADLFFEGDAMVDFEETHTTGAAVATTEASVYVDAGDPFDMQIGDAVFLRTGVSGQAQLPLGTSEAIAWSQGYIYVINSSASDYFIDFRVDWEYSAMGPSRATIAAVNFYADLLFQGTDLGGPGAANGSGDYQLFVPAGWFDQFLMVADTDAVTPVVPVPPSAALVLGMLGILRTVRKRRGL